MTLNQYAAEIPASTFDDLLASLEATGGIIQRMIWDEETLTERVDFITGYCHGCVSSTFWFDAEGCRTTNPRFAQEG